MFPFHTSVRVFPELGIPAVLQPLKGCGKHLVFRLLFQSSSSLLPLRCPQFRPILSYLLFMTCSSTEAEGGGGLATKPFGNLVCSSPVHFPKRCSVPKEKHDIAARIAPWLSGQQEWAATQEASCQTSPPKGKRAWDFLAGSHRSNPTTKERQLLGPSGVGQGRRTK